MLCRVLVFSCDHLGCCFPEGRFASIDLARENGWAVSRDRLHCYCPLCAPMHRNVGRYKNFGRNLVMNGKKYKL